MHAALLLVHNSLRWLILVAAVHALYVASRGLQGDVPYARARRAGAMFLGTLHLQVVVGLVLFLTSPFIRTAMGDMAATMRDGGTRFFIAEHPTMMVAAAVLATIGSIVAKNARDDAARHRKLLVFTAITLLLLLAGIPWQRPLLPGTGG